MTKSGRMIEIGPGRTCLVKSSPFKHRPLGGLEVEVAVESMMLEGRATGVRLIVHDVQGVSSLLLTPHVRLDLSIREATQLAEYLLVVARDAATPRPQLIGGAA